MKLEVKHLQENMRKYGEEEFVKQFNKRFGINRSGVDRTIENADGYAHNLSFVHLAESCMGWEATSALRAGAPVGEVQRLAEAAGLSFTAFPRLAGEAIQQKVIQSYNSEQFLLRSLINSEAQNFSGKGFTMDLDSLSEAEQVGENQSYPWASFNENTIAIPPTVKWGGIIGMTREIFIADRTSELMRQASSVGSSIAIAVEKEIGRVMLGVDNTYERNGTQQDTYGADNEVTNFVLTGWRDFDALDAKFNEMVDPVSLEPLEMPTRDVLTAFVTLKREAMHLINSTSVHLDTNNSAGTSNDRSIDGNPISDLGSVRQSTRLYHIAQAAAPFGLGLDAAVAKTLCIYGDLRSAFVRKVNWPLETVEYRDTHWAQDKDIIAAWKASERSRTAIERRHTVLRAYNSAA